MWPVLRERVVWNAIRDVANLRAGAIVAMAAAMIGVNLGGLAWARGRRAQAGAAERGHTCSVAASAANTLS
jgi:hypothetical protein